MKISVKKQQVYLERFSVTEFLSKAENRRICIGCEKKFTA